MISPAIGANVVNGPLQERSKLFPLLRGKAPDDPFLVFRNLLVHPFMAGAALFQNHNPLASPVFEVGFQGDKALLFQSGQKPGYGGMCQLKGRFYVLGIGGSVPPVEQEGQQPSLGRGQIHFFQVFRHRLIAAPMKNANQMTIVDRQ